MRIADESAVPHGPPQVGEEVEIRMRGTVLDVRDGLALVHIAANQTEEGEDVTVWRAEETVATLRDVPHDLRDSEG